MSINPFSQSETQEEVWISACLADISILMSSPHLKLNLEKPELMFLLGKASPIHNLSINIHISVVPGTQTAWNLLGTLEDQLSCAANITVTTCSCRFVFGIIRRTRLLLTQKATQVLVQAFVISHTTPHPNLPRLLVAK